MTASQPSPTVESASEVVHSGVQIRRTASGELVIVIKRFRDNRSQNRREQREFRAWLAITAKPLW
jgi:hypothetical protein